MLKVLFFIVYSISIAITGLLYFDRKLFNEIVIQFFSKSGIQYDYRWILAHEWLTWQNALIVTVGLTILFALSFLFKPKQGRYSHIKTTKAIKNLTWREFEYYVAYIFEKKGFHVIVNGADGGGGDGNIDVIAKKRFKKYLIQCKHYTKPIDVSEVRKIIGTGVIHKGSKVFIYTTSNFTKPAIEEAKRGKAVLMDCEDIVKEVNKIKNF